ncbi:MAG TPA: carboxypeptidase regulatory-like domain-containing protein [Planctomycetes bacterium]|nr:carboxypeptidase regulatory-like domain-containing protein [Planctomycetota bacterium]
MQKICAIVLSLSLTVAAFGGQAEPLTCTGRIVNAGGQPIPKAKVILYYLNSRWGMGNRIARQTESGTDGLFTFKDSLKYSNADEYPHGRDSYILLATHPDYAFGWKKIDRDQEQTAYEIKLTEPKSQTITVTDHDGNPLAGARVWPYSVGSRSDSEPSFRDSFFVYDDTGVIGAVTDSNGLAVVTHLPKTRCSFHASLKGYATGLSFSGSRPIRLSKGATVSGTVLTENNKPVENALVKFHTEWMWNFFLTRTDS